LACLAVVFFAGGASTAAAPLFAQPQLDALLRRDCGVSLEPVYYGETFTNTRGGISNRGATGYETLLDLPLTLDFEKTSLPLSGKCFLLAQNTHGRGLTDDVVGDTQVISNIDSGGNVTQLSECWWEYALFDGRLPGTVDVGVGYFSGGDVSGVALSSAQGYYVQVEQLVFRERPGREGDAQGLGAFVSYFPRFASGVIPLGAVRSNVVGGIVYRGPIPCRNDDVVGAGVAWAKLNRSGTLQETVVEFFYKAQIGPRTSLQPDVQYIASPSGIYRDALAVGLRFQVAY